MPDSTLTLKDRGVRKHPVRAYKVVMVHERTRDTLRQLAERRGMKLEVLATRLLDSALAFESVGLN